MPRFDDLSVLVIDESKSVRDTVRRILRAVGVGRIRLVADGPAGLKMVARHGFDVVLCDLSTDPARGLGFVETLRRHDDPSLRALPVIILTRHSDPNIVRQAIEQGIDGYLLKPVSLNAIKARIEQVLDGRSSQRRATG